MQLTTGGKLPPNFAKAEPKKLSHGATTANGSAAVKVRVTIESFYEQLGNPVKGAFKYQLHQLLRDLKVSVVGEVNVVQHPPSDSAVARYRQAHRQGLNPSRLFWPLVGFLFVESADHATRVVQAVNGMQGFRLHPDGRPREAAWHCAVAAVDTRVTEDLAALADEKRDW